jgi:signal transduction histidine kinase
LSLVEPQAASSNVETKIDKQGEIPAVMADPESLRSARMNLIIYLLQATDGTGGKLSIVLASEDHGKRARIEISDTGRGIAPEDISKVFEPYYSTKETGTGLGLAIVRKAVDDHHGTISVKSKLAEGTSFTITLPVSEAGAVATGS